MRDFLGYESRLRKWAAAEFSWTSGIAEIKCQKNLQPTLTVPVDISLATQERSRYYSTVLEPERKQREQEMALRKEAAAREAKERDAKALAEFRKSLVHQPLPLPSFDKPFRPSSARSTPPLGSPYNAAGHRKSGTQSATPRMYRHRPTWSTASTSTMDRPPIARRTRKASCDFKE